MGEHGSARAAHAAPSRELRWAWTLTLKEHCHNAAASLAGVPDTELSFPEIIARCCASRIPGIQP